MIELKQIEKKVMKIVTLHQQFYRSCLEAFSKPVRTYPKYKRQAYRFGFVVTFPIKNRIICFIKICFKFSWMHHGKAWTKHFVIRFILDTGIQCGVYLIILYIEMYNIFDEYRFEAIMLKCSEN